jgi:hypothetical protein
MHYSVSTLVVKLKTTKVLNPLLKELRQNGTVSLDRGKIELL